MLGFYCSRNIIEDNINLVRAVTLPQGLVYRASESILSREALEGFDGEHPMAIPMHT